MFALRCTRKLLERLRASPVPDLPEPTTKLGNWYANFLRRPGGQVLLFVNELTLLPVLIPRSPVATVLTRFREATGEVLVRLGVDQVVVDAELREMAEVAIPKTGSRQVLGSMNDFEVLMGAYGHDRPLIDIALKLADAPCSPIGMRRPGEVAREVLRGRE